MRTLALLLMTVPMVGCGSPPPQGATTPSETAGFPPETLAQARQGFVARPRESPRGDAPERPPAGLFQLVKYESPVGRLSAYLTPDPKDGRRRPAILWITGGDCNSIGDVWSPADPSNDQTAAAFRKAGIVMMFPGLRGGNDNPGQREGFLGEVEDVLAAADFLARQPHVDPTRLYLGGHSTGGTLALLVAEVSDRFRAVFSFGPVDEVAGYGPRYCPFDLNSQAELRVRSPGRWLHGVRVPTLVVEGAEDGNADCVHSMAASAATTHNPNLTFVVVPGTNHFSVLSPVNQLLAEKVRTDTGEAAFRVTAAEVTAAVRKQ